MKNRIDRRRFLAGSSGAALWGATPLGIFAPGIQRTYGISRIAGTALRIGLNAYSFDSVLRDRSMSLGDVVDYCARQGSLGLDATGYYFPGYPEVPDDAYVNSLKRHAFVNGVTLYGTGVRNDFATPDPESRRRDVQLVKSWIEVARKLGAGTVRIFAGPGVPDGYEFDQVLEWMVPEVRDCAAHAEKNGVLVAIQHHNGFLKTSGETIRLVERIGSEWCGVMLDVGSLRSQDPYEEIERLVPYAVSWQLKESVWYGNREETIDLERLRGIIERHGYRGYLSVETLGPGDPKQKVDRFLRKVRRVFD